MAEVREVIVVRSLTDSDLGLLAAHRASATSKQRAININVGVARQILSPELFVAGGYAFDCICTFGELSVRQPRIIGKSGKNWRLGGKKLEGEAFAAIDSKDFVLMRTASGNDGTYPVSITFISRQTDRITHAGLAAIVERKLDQSMVVFDAGSEGFNALAPYCKSALQTSSAPIPAKPARLPAKPAVQPRPAIPPIPRQHPPSVPTKKPTMHEKLRSPHILERMFRVAGDLSASAQVRFIEIVERLATQLRTVLLATNRIITVKHSHREFWPEIAGQPVGFIDGGLANLAALGAAPIAARVGGYLVTPGMTGPDREQFIMLKHLIDELFAGASGGVYDDSFPDISALRDAARISIEAAGAVQMLAQHPEAKWILLHGALVNPVSRYTDIMQDGRVRHIFPNFSDAALNELLPENEPDRTGRDRNFISVYLRQLQLMRDANAVVCGVVEREATTSSVCRAVVDSLDDDSIARLIPTSPEEWKHWFRHAIDPADDPDSEGQRVTDSLLFSCVLEPGEAIFPVEINRNERRRAPPAWRDAYIVHYPRPFVSYIQVTQWSPPVRVEIFENNLDVFPDVARLVSHCSLLLPRYAFPVGLDIVDRFAKIPNWMTRPINTHTTVQALKRALDSGDTRSFDALRRLLCGSSREWLLRPGLTR